MATPLSTIISQARGTLNEPVAIFWTDAELLVHAVDCCRQLWKKIIDLNQGHFQTIDDTHVSLAANTATLSGVPADCFRVELISVRDQTTASSVQNMTFRPCTTRHADWDAARAMGPVDPSGREILFSIRNAGSPVTTPSIDVAPTITAAVNLRLIYTNTLAVLTASDNNPIPGESDHAIYAWIVAHARARERETHDPDPEWLAVFASDETSILTALTPRQIQEPEVAEALFESYWS